MSLSPKVLLVVTFAALWLRTGAVVDPKPKCPRTFRAVRFNDGKLQCFFVSGLSVPSDRAEKMCHTLAPGSHLLSADDRYFVVQFLVLVLGKMKHISHPLRTGLQCQNQENCRFHGNKKKSVDIFQVRGGRGECVSLQRPHYLTGKFVPCAKSEHFVCSVSAEKYSSQPSQSVENLVTRTTYVPLGTCSGARSNHAKASLPLGFHIRIKGEVQKPGWCKFELSNHLNKDQILLMNIHGEKTDFSSKLNNETWSPAVIRHDKTANTPKALLPGHGRFDMTIYRAPGNTYEVYVNGELFQAFKSRVNLRPTRVDVCMKTAVDCVEVKEGRPEQSGGGKRGIVIKTRTVDDMLNDAKRRKKKRNSGMLEEKGSGNDRSKALSLTDSLFDAFPEDGPRKKEERVGSELSQRKEKKRQMTKNKKLGGSGRKRNKPFSMTDALFDVAKDMSRKRVNEKDDMSENDEKTTKSQKRGDFRDKGKEAFTPTNALSGDETKGRPEKVLRRTDERSEKKARKERNVAERKKNDIFNFDDDLFGGAMFEKSKNQKKHTHSRTRKKTPEKIKEKRKSGSGRKTSFRQKAGSGAQSSVKEKSTPTRISSKKSEERKPAKQTKKKKVKAPLEFDFSDDLFSDMVVPKKVVGYERCRGTSKDEYSRPVPVGWHARVRGRLQKSGYMPGFAELVFENGGNTVLKAYMRGGGIDFNSYTKRANFLAKMRSNTRPKPPKSLLPFQDIVFEKFDVVVYRASERKYRTYVNGVLYKTYKTSVNETPTKVTFSGGVDVDCFEVAAGNPVR